MRALSKYSWNTSPDNWVLNLELYAETNSFVASLSDGLLRTYLLDQLSPQPVQTIRAHESSINSIKKIDANTIASCSTDGIKIWDLRSATATHTLKNNNSNFLSIDYSNNLLAGGTELIGVDAELNIWDLRNPSNVVRTFIDSHHDDITDIKFHPTMSNYLMSGSTDGYVNIYNLDEPEEEDALHQVINYTSVHSCHFTQPNRILILSHMETLAFYELNNTNYEQVDEPLPRDLGDIRSVWPDCEYVVDVNPSGYVAYGANSQQKLTLLPFDPIAETFDVSRPIWFPLAHGEEVVRDFKVLSSNSALSCGEDGTIKLWELPYEILIQQEKKEKKSKEEKTQKKDKKEKKEKKEKKDKKEKKEKKDKKDKKKKSDIRFKPY